MSVKCKSCGKYIMSVFKDTCDECVSIQAEQERKAREREARNKRTREEAERERARWAADDGCDDIIQNSILMASAFNHNTKPTISGLSCNLKQDDFTSRDDTSCRPTYDSTPSYTPSYESSSSYSFSDSCSSSSSSSGCD